MTVVLIILQIAILVFIAITIRKNNEIKILNEQIDHLEETNIKIGADLTDVKKANFLLDKQLKEANELKYSTNKQLSEAYESLNKKRDYEKQLLEKHSEDLITVKDLTAENEILKERQTKHEHIIIELKDEIKNLKDENERMLSIDQPKPKKPKK